VDPAAPRETEEDAMRTGTFQIDLRTGRARRATIALLSLLAVAGLAPTAGAHDEHHGARPRVGCGCDLPPVCPCRDPGGYGSGYGHGYGYGGPSTIDLTHVYRADRYGRPRGGTSWAVLRRHLIDTRAFIREQYVRRYFLRRWPHVIADLEGEQAEEAVERLLAPPADGAGPLPSERRLERAMLHFHAARYADAREDFLGVLAERPGEARARLGATLCACVRNDWSDAVKELTVLARAGELRADDRLDVEGSFSDPDRWETLREGLRGYVRYRFAERDAQMVFAWTGLLEGDADRARIHLGLARRFGAKGALVEALERAAGVAEPLPEPPKAAPPTRDPVAPPIPPLVAEKAAG
jgi:hypothetical protein